MNTGDRVGGHFEILEKLGTGGMGEVWKACDTRLNRIVAIKTLKSQTDRFEREARAIAALNHPHICAIYDIGPDYLVMEYVDGMPPKRPMPLNEVLRLGAQVADALAAAHAAGITHRDLKPDNILVTKEGRAKVLDFGLAKLADAIPGQQDGTQTMALTEEGTIVGTAAYMSPEQAEGKKSDSRSDIFSLGTVLYELITGRRPFQGDSKMSTLAAVLREEPKPISDLMPAVPPEVAKLIAKMMRKDPERRVQSMADVKLTLQDLRDESSSGTSVAPPPQPKGKRWLVLTAVAGVIAVAGAVLWMKRAPAPEAPPTLIQVTSFPGREITPALSPDGRQIAFAWDGDKEDGTFDIYVKLVDAGSPVRLTTDPASDFAPVWSPDGTYIAFYRDGSNAGIYVMPALGGQERKVASLRESRNPQEVALPPTPEWSADGKTLLFPDVSVEPWITRWVSMNGEQQGQLPPPPAGYSGDSAMAISPDGTSMTFNRQKSVSVRDQMLVKMGENWFPRRRRARYQAPTLGRPPGCRIAKRWYTRGGMVFWTVFLQTASRRGGLD